jgi:hypothetical protein
VDKYLPEAELSLYMQATDIYVAPYIGRDQVSSGTITFALTHGKAIVSTPTIFAEEALSKSGGLLCEFGDEYSIARCVQRILNDSKLGTGWKRTRSSMANDYHGERWRTNTLTSSDLQSDLRKLLLKLRESVKLDHLFALTDHIALLQHAKFSTPARREGYTTDDNSRALVFAVKAEKFWPSQHLTEFQRNLLAFILLMQADDGRSHNIMDFSQRILDQPATGDHLGRGIWAAATVINSELPDGMKNSARHIFDRALPWAIKSHSQRTKAYTCLGLAERLKAGDKNFTVVLNEVATDLLNRFKRNSNDDWTWFEDTLTYDNARLSQALFAAYDALRKEEYLTSAEKSLSFLLRVTNRNEIFAPIGNDGWYRKGGKAAEYDQQPIDAGAMVETAAFAYKLTSRKIYERAFRQALGWYFGLNTKNVTVYDPTSGACYDGITLSGLNQNQGAESTLSFLLGAVTAIENLGS